MITAEDVRFHTPDPTPYDWAETNFFFAFVPEHNIYAWIYIVARPGVGSTMCDIQVIDRVGTNPLDARYVDIRQHLPLPERLDDYQLPNGLSLSTSRQPFDYDLQYKGIDDTDIAWSVRGLMSPYDINDPSMDPLAANGDSERTGFGAAYSSHFDMTVRVRGTMRIRGRDFDVDCASVMDHSWGVRNESQMRPMAWINACFDDDTSVNTIWARHLDERGQAAYSFAHGYIHTGSTVSGLRAGVLRAIRGGEYFPIGYEMEVDDVEGQSHRLLGTVSTQIPWSPYSNIVDAHSLVKWHYGDRVGHGSSQELVPLDTRTGWTQ